MAETKTKFKKISILASKKFARYRDLLGIILADDKTYTYDEVNKIITTELKRKVK